jgi:hypothetical protein
LRWNGVIRVSREPLWRISQMPIRHLAKSRYAAAFLRFAASRSSTRATWASIAG